MIVGFVLPLIHVMVTPGLALPPKSVDAEGATCPFSPRAGWLVIVLFLGPIGWLMFVSSRRKRRRKT